MAEARGAYAGVEVEMGTAAPSGKFQMTAEDAAAFGEEKNIQVLRDLGGVEGVAEKLGINLEEGIPLSEEADHFSSRRGIYGANVYPEEARVGILTLFFEALKDKTLMILSGVALVGLILWLITQFALGGLEPCRTQAYLAEMAENAMNNITVESHEEEAGEPNGWIESVAIFAAVLIVSAVTAWNDWNSANQFRSLNAVKNNRAVKVRRGGIIKEVSIYDVNVGDVVKLDTGDQVPADGLFVSGYNMLCDESVMTGESDACKKNAERPFMLSGTQVSSGVGEMLVTAVGQRSEWGKTMGLLQGGEDEGTPLQERLLKMADQIGVLGLAMAVLTLLGLLAVFIIADVVVEQQQCSAEAVVGKLIHFVIITVTVVVVAVPEGLPLAVTISLAYSTGKMLQDQNLVRKLAACETMGGATNICSDKTGTLTQNLMTVTKAWLGNVLLEGDIAASKEQLDAELEELLVDGICGNSTAEARPNEEKPGQWTILGSKTEGALLVLTIKMGADYRARRKTFEAQKLQMYAFSSANKRMSVVRRLGDSQSRLYVKGASEIVLARCTHAFIDGQIVELTEQKREELMTNVIHDWACQGLRTLCLAYRDFDSVLDGPEHADNPQDDNLICYAIVGIKDPVREAVPKAVMDCVSAGIFVRMVTGDNIDTAKHIARECGILTDNGIAIEGPDFRKLSHREMDAILPRLQVMARSSPTDKYTLVKRLRELGEVVAVTGDGTNDAPALHEADVGLAMGIAGTEVAKEASDVIIMDDNFASIVAAVKWGRNVYTNVRKFLQFQLTVNIVAVTVTFIAAVTRHEPPLNAVQLLWVNLIMDSLGALALATELPTDELLLMKPYGRTDPLVSRPMWRNMLCQALYQMVVILVFLYHGPAFLPDLSTNAEMRAKQVNTVIYNLFVLCQVFNEINCRKISELNVFQNLHKNHVFCGVLFITIGMQIISVQVPGVNEFFSCVQLTGAQWGICIGLAAVTLPWGVVVHLIPIKDKAPAHAPLPLMRIPEESMELAQSLARLDGKEAAEVAAAVAELAAKPDFAPQIVGLAVYATDREARDLAEAATAADAATTPTAEV